MVVPSPEPPLQARAPANPDYPRLQAELLGFFRSRLPSEAEELCQRTWSRTLAAAPSCADAAAFRAYLFTCARRVLADRHRRRLRRAPLVPLGQDDPPAGSAERPDQQAGAPQLAQLAQRSLDAMPPEMAQVFRWRLQRDMSFREIARRQGVPLNTALGRMHRAVRRLRAALEQAAAPQGSTSSRGAP